MSFGSGLGVRDVSGNDVSGNDVNGKSTERIPLGSVRTGNRKVSLPHSADRTGPRHIAGETEARSPPGTTRTAGVLR
ncbi:hypothetical protein Mth01_40090 [Sphaerimonospora thailandensis]|uniref:Uncharacterized protein n=1 Tax=Sphaerimonospora thailandensis TaxID=795644 RepID=A0A8J3R9A8_9ACTN|nr:hypothetical protein Mth01_40090 [Sphaerimonospora thailandensis]